MITEVADGIPAPLLKEYPALDEGETGSTFTLDDASTVWYVEDGAIDVFSLVVESGTVTSPLKHVLRAEAGSVVFGADPLPNEGLLLWAKALPGLRTRRIPEDEFFDGRFGRFTAEAVDDWVCKFTEAIVSEIEIVPFPNLRIGLSEGISFDVPSVVSARGDVVWIGSSRSTMYLGTVSTDRLNADLVPVTSRSWVVAGSDDNLCASPTEDVLQRGLLGTCLRDFHRLALEATHQIRLLTVADAAFLQLDRTTLRQREEEEARVQLGRLAAEEIPTTERGSDLFEALKAIGAREGIEFVEPRRPEHGGPGTETLSDILLASDVRSREVALPNGQPWWHGDNGTLLGFLGDDGRPVALLPSQWGRYRMFDPVTGRCMPVGPRTAGALEERAWMFYSPLPKRPAVRSDIMHLMFARVGPELVHYLFAGLLVGLIAFAPPVALGLLADEIAPVGDTDLLHAAVAALLFLGLLGALVQLDQSFRLVRFEGRATTRVTAAIWDRLIHISIRHLDQYLAGDLAARAMVFMRLREALSGTVANALASVLFLLPALGLLVAYEPLMALIILIFGIVVVVSLLAVALLQLKWHEKRLQAHQRLIGRLYEFIGAMPKIQKSGAIGSVFAAWARQYQIQKNAAINASRLNELLVAMAASAPLLASALLLGLVALDVTPNVSAGHFLAIYAAATVFFSALTRLGASTASLTEVFPSLHQVAPLLETTPESRKESKLGWHTPDNLVGDLRLDQISFRYDADGPLVLEGVSMHVDPGEFVAIVGESGSGKSTVFKLLLGLEFPTSGAVYYDGQNLTAYNLQGLRRRIGVVAQDSSLMPGSILQNIVGIDSHLSVRDAWRAAELAAIDEDIKDMPMGMHTSVGEHATLFSGGQAQRILIAAALVRNPRILFLDEATNWLDNESQASVVESINCIAATRVVVAHRLSTIRGADRIYVMHEGRVVEEGTFDQLANASGKFQELISRQTL